ncbi:MAG: hypothetical protein FJZ67_09825 [Bacteroidetes bacterium]|nr:hypothetical protein [Bacteroidota bacterium]
MFEIISTHTNRTLIVQEFDLPEKMSYYDAVLECTKFPDGWRLPTMGELRMMFNMLYIKGKGNFNPVYYWSGDSFDELHAKAFAFSPGTGTLSKEVKLPIRLVKVKSEITDDK